MKFFCAILALSYAVSSSAQVRREATPAQAQVEQDQRLTDPVDQRVQRERLTAPAEANLVNQLLQGNTARRIDGGSGIGGGTVYENLITWCSQATEILQDAAVQGREVWGMSGNASQTLALFVDGLEYAQSTAQSVQTVSETFTLRYVQRGLSLSQILGVDYITRGQVLPGRDTRALVNFFDWYLGHTVAMGRELDRALHIPYVSRRSCRGSQCNGIPRVTSQDLESKTVDMTIGVLRNLSNRFVRVLPDYNNMYSSVGTPTYLRALAYLLGETARDLRASMYGESFVCEAGEMNQLAMKIQRFIGQRQGNSQDAIKLNEFQLGLNNILRKIDNDQCR